MAGADNDGIGSAAKLRGSAGCAATLLQASTCMGEFDHPARRGPFYVTVGVLSLAVQAAIMAFKKGRIRCLPFSGHGRKSLPNTQIRRRGRHMDHHDFAVFLIFDRMVGATVQWCNRPGWVYDEFFTPHHPCLVSCSVASTSIRVPRTIVAIDRSPRLTTSQGQGREVCIRARRWRSSRRAPVLGSSEDARVRAGYVNHAS